MIPKIIHHVYLHNDEDLPSPFDELTKTWKTFFPNWEVIVWKDSMCLAFLKKYYPQFLPRYYSYPKEIQRVDAVRYLILKEMGGMYVDNDFECLCNFESLFGSYDFIAGKEDKEHSDKYQTDYIVGNALMASTPNNRFIEYVCEKLMDYTSVEVNCGKDILDSTGPFLLTNAYNDFPKKEKIYIADSDAFYPLSKWEIQKLHEKEIPCDIKSKINNAYAIHYAFGTWEGK